MSVTELHSILLSNPNDGGLNDDMDEDNNNIISDYKLLSILPPKLKQISEQ